MELRRFLTSEYGIYHHASCSLAVLCLLLEGPLIGLRAIRLLDGVVLGLDPHVEQRQLGGMRRTVDEDRREEMATYEAI